MESIDTSRPVRFGSFELDVRLRELRKGETRVRLQEQPFEILRLMLERPGDVVTREQLRQRLWPDGTYVDFEHSLNAAVKRLRAALGDDADNPRFVETLPRRGYRFIAPLAVSAEPRVSVEAAARPHVRVAVLPFSNLTEDPAQEFFSDGLTEEMISQLGRMCGGRFGVIARWSSMLFKRTSLRAREIAEALQVNYLVEGSVRHEGERVRITTRLVAADTETTIWSDTCERHLTDCLSVQADVAARIAFSLARELIPEQRSTRHTRCEPAAYQEYLKGRYCWNKPFDEGLNDAIAFYERSIAAAPSFGAAHAALARALVARAEYYGEPPRQVLQAARDCAVRALDIDRGLHEAWVALADIRRMHDFDWAAAESAYTDALAVNPSAVSAHRTYAAMLSTVGRHAEAIRESDRAIEMDPLCLAVGTTAAWVRYLAGDYDASIDHSRNTIDMDPACLTARRLLGAAYLQAGRATEALAELQSAASLAAGDPVLLAWLAHAYAATGSRPEATALIARVERLDAACYVSPYHLALAHVGVGSLDAAFALLEQAWLDRDPALSNVHVDPRFESLRADPRYGGLVARLRITNR
jgi:TolB-like protein/tetratricopeptide (TPR) repeat protein